MKDSFSSPAESAAPVLTPLERLLAIEDIKQLKARYLRSLDQQDWELFSSLFTPDVTVDFREGTPDHKSSNLMFPKQLRADVIQGVEKWVEAVKKGRAARNAEGSVSMHHGHMPEIEVLSACNARGIWAMEDLVFWRTGDDRKTVHGFGFYFETYSKIEGVWKIASMRLERLRVAPIAP